MTPEQLSAAENSALDLDDKLTDARPINGMQALLCHGRPLSGADVEFLQQVGPTVIRLTAQVRSLSSDLAATRSALADAQAALVARS
jgi:hypothetical protein